MWCWFCPGKEEWGRAPSPQSWPWLSGRPVKRWAVRWRQVSVSIQKTLWENLKEAQCNYYSTCGQCVPKVGILDVDLCGPSIPRMLNIVHTDVHQCDSGWVPVYTDAQQSLALMSIGFLLEDPDEAVVWRGPKKTGMPFSSWKYS